MTAVPPLGDADPATRILVAGYGAITAGITPHLTGLTDTHVTIASRHLKQAPPGTVLIRPDDMAPARPDIVIGAFAHDEASRAFWQHPRTRATVTAHGSTCIELSTISPTWAEAWHDHTTAAGGLPIECPVTGSRPGARAGTLTAFLHSPGPLNDANLRTLGAFTARRFTFSRPGNPARFKLIFNSWGATLLHCAGVFARQLPQHLAEDYPTAADAITSVGWMADLAAAKLDRIERADYSDPDVAVRHMLKDVELARDLMSAANLHELPAIAEEVMSHRSVAQWVIFQWWGRRASPDMIRRLTVSAADVRAVVTPLQTAYPGREVILAESSNRELLNWMVQSSGQVATFGSEHEEESHLRQRGIRAVIPQPADQIGHRLRRGQAGGRPPAFDAEAYKQRNSVERCINRLKQWRGLAMRTDKLAIAYQAALHLAAILIWARR